MAEGRPGRDGGERDRRPRSVSRLRPQRVLRDVLLGCRARAGPLEDGFNLHPRLGLRGRGQQADGNRGKGKKGSHGEQNAQLAVALQLVRRGLRLVARTAPHRERGVLAKTGSVAARVH